MKGINESIHAACTFSFVRMQGFLMNNAHAILFFGGIMLLYGGLQDLAMAYVGGGTYSGACNGILSLVEGAFGALITAAAGIGAIVASAVGGFKMAWSLVVVAVGAFILRAYITLFNGYCNDGGFGVDGGGGGFGGGGFGGGGFGGGGFGGVDVGVGGGGVNVGVGVGRGGEVPVF